MYRGIAWYHHLGTFHTFISWTLAFGLLSSDHMQQLKLLRMKKLWFNWSVSMQCGSIWISRRWLDDQRPLWLKVLWNLFDVSPFLLAHIQTNTLFYFPPDVSPVSSGSLYEQIKNLQDIFLFISISWRESIYIFHSTCPKCIIKLQCWWWWQLNWRKRNTS